MVQVTLGLLHVLRPWAASVTAYVNAEPGTGFYELARTTGAKLVSREPWQTLPVSLKERTAYISSGHSQVMGSEASLSDVLSGTPHFDLVILVTPEGELDVMRTMLQRMPGA